MSDAIIELNRRFVKFSDGPTALDVETHLWVTQALDKGITWDELLKNRWTVILGEAGIGKTKEFEFRAKRLRDAGQHAFFMDIALLAKHGPQVAASRDGLKKALEDWRRGTEEAFFFLDSVDDAKLHQQTLDNALAQLNAYLDEASPRARLVVSSRVSDWSTASDRSSLVRFIEVVLRQERENSARANAGLVAAARRLASKLASTVHDPDDAKRVATRAEFPVQHIPAFKTAAIFWNDIIDQALNRGAVAAKSALAALARTAVNEHPYNAELHDIESLIDTSTHRTTDTHRHHAVSHSQILSHESAFDPTTPSGEEELRIVQILPFDDDQVRRFAAHRGASDVDALLTAVHEAGAQPLIASPLDVEWLVEHWADRKDLGNLGSWKELVECAISKRLEDRRGKCPPSMLEHGKARDGLQRLAATAILTGRWSFLVPGERALDERRDDILDPRQILTDNWSEADIRDLLTRAIFDEATYGCIRFHHRTVQEHLAAEWLRVQIGRGLTHRNLERLIFRMTGRHRFVPRHLMATAGWLAIRHEHTREQLIATAPEILMMYGDPGSLPTEARTRALSAYLARYTDRSRLFDDLDRTSLARFAPALGDAVKQHLARQDLPEDALAFLLTLVEDGRLAECSSEAISWALDETASSRIRCNALRAASAIASSSDKQTLTATLLQTMTAWDERLAGIFISKFFPDFLTAPQLGQILVRTTFASSNHVTSLKAFLRVTLPKICPPKQKLPLLRIMTDSAQATKSKESLLLGVQKLAHAFIDTMPNDQDPPAELQDALNLIRNEMRDPRHDLPNLDTLKASIASRPRIKRWLFWTQAEEFKSKNGNWPSPVQIYDYYALSEVDHTDTTWLSKDARSHSEAAARKLAFLQILLLQTPDNPCTEIITSLTKVDTEFARIEHEVEMQRTATRDPHPHELRMRQMHEELERQRTHQRTEDLRVLTENIESIRSGQHRDLLSWIYSRNSADTDHFEVKLDSLEEEFGPEIASAARSGFTYCWRNHDPLLPHEQKEWNDIPPDIPIGVIGIGLSFADGLDVTTLGPTEIKRLTRYAIRDLNRLPSWFKSLATVHTTEVLDALRPAIVGDLRIDDPQHHPVVLGFDWCLPSILREPIAQILLEELEGAEPSTSRVLGQALHMCQSLPTSDDGRVSSLCKSRITGADTPEHRASWWATWLRKNPPDAVDYLAAQPRSDGEIARVLEIAFAKLNPDRRFKLDAGLLTTDSEALERLIPIAYDLIPPGQDVDTDGFSPVTRPDSAGRFRDRLIDLLVAIGTPAALAGLERLAAHPVMGKFRDQILSRVGGCAQQSAQARPMSPLEALEWCRSRALPIRDASDLHRVVLDRLDDIKYAVERGERNHYRNFFNPKEGPIKEASIQHWISYELEQANTSGYSLVREEEVGRQKKPDIRIHHSSCTEHPISIEIKIAERWTFDELLRALHEQLVGQYLRANKSRHGILLLCSSGPPRKSPWTATDSPIDFPALVEILRREAGEIESTNAEVDALDVVDIDFH